MKPKQEEKLLPRLDVLSDKVTGEYSGVFEREDIQEIMAEIVAYRAMAKVQGITSPEYAVLSFVFAVGYITGREDVDG